jgi:hypothetical protein
MAEDKGQQPLDLLTKALNDPNVPKIYANGFVQGASLSDMFVMFQRSGAPTAVLNMPLTTAKTLAEKLTGAIADIESKLGQPIPTMDQMRSVFEPDHKG